MGAIKRINDLILRYKDKSFVTSMMLAFTQSIIALFFILVDFVFSKKLEIEKFGAWKQMYFFLNLLIPILSFGIPEGYKYYIAREGKKPIFFSNAFYMFILSTIIGIFILLILNGLNFISILKLKNYYIISAFFPLGYLFFSLNKTLRYTYINESKVWLHTKITTLYLFLTLLLMVLLAYYFNEVKDYYLWLGFLIFLLVFGMPLISLLKNIDFDFSFSFVNKDRIRQMLVIGMPLYLATFIGMMVVNLDKGIVSFFENKTAFAIFSVGAIEIPVFAMLSAAFSQNTYPTLVKYVTEGRNDDAKRLWIKTTLRVSYITYPMILIMIIFAKPILFFIYTTQYVESVKLFQIYLLVGLLRNNYYGALITASGQTKYVTYYSLLTLLFNLVFSVLMYFIWGLPGIIYGTLLSTVIIALLQLKHEKMLTSFFKDFLLDKVIILLISLIIISFIIF